MGQRSLAENSSSVNPIYSLLFLITHLWWCPLILCFFHSIPQQKRRRSSLVPWGPQKYDESGDVRNSMPPEHSKIHPKLAESKVHLPKVRKVRKENQSTIIWRSAVQPTKRVKKRRHSTELFQYGCNCNNATTALNINEELWSEGDWHGDSEYGEWKRNEMR